MKRHNPATLHAPRSTLHEKGFTLIELLVSIGVLAIVSSFIFVSVGVRQSALPRATQKLVLDIREAQNRSLAPLAESICIFGLRFQSTTQYFFYQRTAAECLDGQYRYVAGASTQIGNVISLEEGVSASTSSLDIAFEPPEPITWIGGLRDQSATITLSSAADAKDVRVNRFGRVEIQ